MTNEEYHNIPAISSSDFRLLEESPLHYENKDYFKLDGKALTVGSLVHKMVLEPHTLYDEFVKEEFSGCKLNKNSNAYKEALRDFKRFCEGKQIVPVSMWEEAEIMARNIKAIAGNILDNGVAEQSFFVEDTDGIPRKCRPDFLRRDIKTVIDLKTTNAKNDYEFEKSIFDYKYHRQGAWYIDTLRLCGIDIENFVLITVQTSSPYMVRVRLLSNEAIMAGRENYMKILDKYIKYKKTGEIDIVKTIGLPTWAFIEEAKGE